MRPDHPPLGFETELTIADRQEHLQDWRKAVNDVYPRDHVSFDNIRDEKKKFPSWYPDLAVGRERAGRSFSAIFFVVPSSHTETGPCLPRKFLSKHLDSTFYHGGFIRNARHLTHARCLFHC